MISLLLKRANTQAFQVSRKDQRGVTEVVNVEAESSSHALAQILKPDDFTAQQLWIRDHPRAETWADPKGFYLSVNRV